MLDSAGWDAGAVVGLLAGVELGFGAAVVVGFGSAAPILTGTMLFFNESSAWVTSKAASCWPTPDWPSKLPVYHFEPQVTPSSPPEQDLAAPTADAVRYLVIVSFVKGATAAVFAKKRER